MRRQNHILVLAAILVLTGALGAQTPAGKTLDFSGDPDAHPPVTMPDLKIVQRAWIILNLPSRWNRADTRVCPPNAKTFSLYCALEKATGEVSGDFKHRGAAMQEARFVIDQIAPNRNKYQHRLMDYNNDPTTTFADTQKFFRLLEQRIARELDQQKAP
jgi:hypothetical protein